MPRSVNALPPSRSSATARADTRGRRLLRRVARFIDETTAGEEKFARDTGSDHKAWIDNRARTFFPLLLEYLAIVPAMDQVERVWRERVSRGEDVYTHETDACIQSIYRYWVTTLNHVREHIEFFGRHGTNFPGLLDVLSEAGKLIEGKLAKWSRPVRSLAPGLLTREVPAGRAAEVRAALAAL